MFDRHRNDENEATAPAQRKDIPEQQMHGAPMTEFAQHGPSRLEENDGRWGQGGRAQRRLGFILKARRSRRRIRGKRAGMATVLREIKLNHQTV